MPKIKMTYEQIQARKLKLEQEKKGLEHLLNPKIKEGLIEVEADPDMKIPKKPKVDTTKINAAISELDTKIAKWTALEEQHRPEPKHYIDEMLDGLPDDTELYQDLQLAKSVLK